MHNGQIYFADFETVTKDTEYFKTHNDTRVLLWVVKDYFGNNEQLGTNIKTFFDYFKNNKKKNKKYFCYFHNLNWDGDFILKWLAKNGYKAINNFEWKKNKEVNSFCFVRQSRQIYCIKIKLENNCGKLFELVVLCSYKILSSSVEALGKNLKIDKHNEQTRNVNFYNQEPRNHVNEYPNEFVEYAKRDVEIIRLSFILFKENLQSIIDSKWFLNNINLEKYYTIGSIAYQLQKQYVKHYSINKPEIIEGFKIDHQTHQIASKFYFGGLTQFNPNIQNDIIECTNGAAFDVNSMYPSNMIKKLPYGNLNDFNEYEPDGDYLEFWEMEIESAISKNGIFLCLVNWNKINDEPIHSLNRYVYSLFKFKCFYFKEEFEKLKLFYDFEGVKIVKRYWTRTATYLQEYINDFYALKKKYSILNEPANTLTYKILLNASYGKHATRSDFKELFILENENEYNSLINLDSVKINKKHYKLNECSELVKLENQFIVSGNCLDIKSGNNYYNKLTAAVITAYSRITLYDAVVALGEENFLYCDTDSVYVRSDAFKSNIDTDPYELGKWDTQAEFNYFITKGAKAYLYADDKDFTVNVKSRHSGVNTKWLKNNISPRLFTENELTLELANLKIESCPSGLVLVWKNYKSKKRLN